MKLTVKTNVNCPFCNEPYYFADMITTNSKKQMIKLRCNNCRSSVLKHISRFMQIIPVSEEEMQIKFDHEAFTSSL